MEEWKRKRKPGATLLELSWNILVFFMFAQMNDKAKTPFSDWTFYVNCEHSINYLFFITSKIFHKYFSYFCTSFKGLEYRRHMLNSFTPSEPRLLTERSSPIHCPIPAFTASQTKCLWALLEFWEWLVGATTKWLQLKNTFHLAVEIPFRNDFSGPVFQFLA